MGNRAAAISADPTDCYYRGRVVGSTGSMVALDVCDGRLEGLISEGGRSFALEDNDDKVYSEDDMTGLLLGGALVLVVAVAVTAVLASRAAKRKADQRVAEAEAEAQRQVPAPSPTYPGYPAMPHYALQSPPHAHACVLCARSCADPRYGSAIHF